MIIIGLTGSIGMGKSVTAELFRRAGVPVHDSDAVVHRLYSGSAVSSIEEAFPGAAREGVIDRQTLASRVFGDDDALKRLESIVHPMVEADRQSFRLTHERRGIAVIVFDIPLLFEIGYEQSVDLVAVVEAKETVQKSRVLERPGMTRERFETIMRKQVPTVEKRRRAHVVIDSNHGIPFAERQVFAALRAIAGRT